MWTIIGALRKHGAAATPDAADSLGDDPKRKDIPRGWLMIVAGFIGRLALTSLGGLLASDGASGMALTLGVPEATAGIPPKR